MSKIGQQAINVSPTVMITVQDVSVTIKGKEGVVSFTLPNGIRCEKDGTTNEYHIVRRNDTKEMKSLHGLWRSLIANAVIGVEKPWEKKLEVVGTGFNVKMQGEDLVFKVGYSHPVVFKKVDGIKFIVDGNTKITISGVNKQLVGEVAQKIKMIKRPDAYKGKGIKYEGEKLRIKPGKKAKAAA